MVRAFTGFTRRSLFLLIFILLTACGGAAPPSPTIAPDEALAESTAAPSATPTPEPTATPTALPTAVPTEAPPPTPEVAPVSPEIPFRVEDGVVQKWTVNPETNQEEWVPDESFPALEPKPGERAPTIESIKAVTYQINGEEVRYFGAISAIYGATEAIFINGEWVPVAEINAKDFITPAAPGEVKFANENWTGGRELIESGSADFLEKFQQALIDGNPAYFRWYVGGPDISLNNVLAVAATRNYMLTVPPDGVPKLLLPSWDKTRYSTEFAKRTRRPHTEISTDINFGGLTVLIFTPDQIKNDPILDMVVSGLPKNRLLATYNMKISQYGIVILPDGSLLWVHGEQINPHPNALREFKTTLLGEHPENFSEIARAFAGAYLGAMTRSEGESVRVFPLDPYRYEEPGMISGDEVGLSPFIK